MATLGKHKIIEHLSNGELLINPFIKPNGEFDVEPASYDLRAGIIIWKELNRETGATSIKRKDYNPILPLINQETVHLQPGQVMFVITHEEVKMPVDMCGTVYAKNKFSREGILALTTGHIDPGVQCPIVIRLINLRSIVHSFQLGEPIYTIVFHKLEHTENQNLVAHPPISKEVTLTRTMESANTALGNALNDLSLTNDFIKKEDFGKLFWQMVTSNISKVIAWIVAALVVIATLISGWPTLKELLNQWFGWFKTT